jgi:hypothetical protein
MCWSKAFIDVSKFTVINTFNCSQVFHNPRPRVRCIFVIAKAMDIIVFYTTSEHTAHLVAQKTEDELRTSEQTEPKLTRAHLYIAGEVSKY